MKLKPTNKYDDIIDLPHPVSTRRSRMTDYDRAAQFAPFAALTGYDAVIEETARLTDRRIELDEGSRAELDEALREILEKIHTQPEISVTWFVYDERKAGGAYLHTRGRVKKADLYAGFLLLTDESRIPLREVVSLQLTE